MAGICLAARRIPAPRLREDRVQVRNQHDRALEFDITMMVVVGGKERREEEFRLLLEQAGLRLHQTIRTGAGVAVDEDLRRSLGPGPGPASLG